MEIEFLDIEDVLYIHENQIRSYGGEHGVRDEGLLLSAIAQPRATFDGKLLHEDIFAMAAAYLFHIVKNHPFLDGNKRTGAVTAIAFLDWNGVELRDDNEGLVELTVRAATGEAGKQEISEFFRTHVIQR